MARPTLLDQLEATLPPIRLADLAAQKRRELETVLLLDVSGSMLQPVGALSPLTRIRALEHVLADLDLDAARIVFGVLDSANGVRQLHPGEPLPSPIGGTPLGAALDLARAQGYRRAIIISDGEPNDPGHARRAAQSFGGRIDAFYVGYPGGPGEALLRALVTASGGAMNTISLAEPAQLEAGLRGLLTAGTASGSPFGSDVTARAGIAPPARWRWSLVVVGLFCLLLLLAIVSSAAR